MDANMGFTIWLFNIAMENGPFIDGLPIKNGDFPWLCEITRGYRDGFNTSISSCPKNIFKTSSLICLGLRPPQTPPPRMA